MSALISSFFDNVIAQVVEKTTTREVWTFVENLFSSQSHARVTQLHYQLATISKGSSSIPNYYRKLKHLYDTMSAADTPLTPKEFTSYLLAGLSSDYDAFVTSVTALLEPLFLKPSTVFSLPMRVVQLTPIISLPQPTSQPTLQLRLPLAVAIIMWKQSW